MKYRKKPVVVEAYQWWVNVNDPDVRLREATEWERTHSKCCVDDARKCDKCGSLIDHHGWIDTLEGGTGGAQVVCPGDWIITGVNGERYPCKPAIFALTYEAAVPTEEL